MSARSLIIDRAWLDAWRTVLDGLADDPTVTEHQAELLRARRTTLDHLVTTGTTVPLRPCDVVTLARVWQQNDGLPDPGGR